MGNKVLKIALPLVVLGVIAFVINRTQKSIDENVPDKVAHFDFSTYINEMIESDLKGKPYDQAREEYRRIYDIILTEEQLTVTDSDGSKQPLLPDTAVQGCYGRAFASYWPAFEGWAEDVFKSDWSGKTNQLSGIKNEAEDLQQRNGSSRNDSLTRYLSYISDYYAATDFASEVSCSSKDQYETILAKVKDYKNKYPLRNNCSLVAQLDDVPGTAKGSWRDFIVRKVNKACKKYDLDEFLEAKKPCDEKIAEYNHCFADDKLRADETTNKLKKQGDYLLINEVNKACEIDDYKTFYAACTKLNSIINGYGSGSDTLSGKLGRRRNEFLDMLKK